MTSKAAANRYARALIDVAIAEKGDLDEIERSLAGFDNLMTSHDDLRRVLLNPAVPAARKRTAVEQLTRAGGAPPIAAKMLTLLAERDRLALVPDLLASYRDRVLDYRKVVRAEVTTAAPLGADRAKALQHSLATMTGRSVTLDTKVDPSLIGGIVARIGSTVYDGSVTRQLQKMKEQIQNR